MKAFIAQNCRMQSVAEQLLKVYLVYSRHSTILFTYLFHSIFIFFLVHSKNFKKIGNIVVFFISIGIYLAGIALKCSCFQGYANSITIVQYFIAVGFSLLAVGGSFLLAGVTNHFTECIDPELSSQLNFDENGEKHYSSILKKYLSYSN